MTVGEPRKKLQKLASDVSVKLELYDSEGPTRDLRLVPPDWVKQLEEEILRELLSEKEAVLETAAKRNT